MNNICEIVLQRESDNGITTLGKIKFGKNEVLSLEDAHHDIKIPGKTRIPSGRYEIILRNEGSFHEKMEKRFPFHRGMLWLQDVPNYKWILIHPGNDAEDTRGCIMPGSYKINDNEVSESTNAYLFLYGYIISQFDSGNKVFITIIDN